MLSTNSANLIAWGRLKVKRKVSSCLIRHNATKIIRELRYKSTILDLVVSFIHRPLYPRKNSHQFSSGGPQSRSGSCGEEKNLLPLPEINLGRPNFHYTDWAILAPIGLGWLRTKYWEKYLDLRGSNGKLERNTKWEASSFVLLIRYYQVDQIKEDKMGEAYSTYEYQEASWV
jgi:hypothetical protein